SALRQRFGDGLALGGRARGVGLDAELVDRPVEELIRRGRALLALAMERPAQHGLSAAIVFGLHPLEPCVDQRRFAGAALGNEREDVGLAIGPSLIKAREFFIASD